MELGDKCEEQSAKGKGLSAWSAEPQLKNFGMRISDLPSHRKSFYRRER